MTELQYDAYCGDMDALIHHLGEGLADNAVDIHCIYTPAHWLADMAVTGGPRAEMLSALVSHDADVNISRPDGTTAPAECFIRQRAAAQREL